MLRSIVFLGTSLVLASPLSCGPKHVPSGVKPSVEVAPRSEAVVQADSIVTDFEATTAPQPEPHATKEEATAFVQGPLKSWYSDASKRLNEADQRLGKLPTTSTHDKASILLARARIQTFLSDQFLRSGRSSIPDEWKADEDIAGAYYGALDGAIRPRQEAALGLLDQCLALGLSVDTQVAQECARRHEALRASLPPGETKESGPAEPDPIYTPYLKYEFRAKASKQPSACVFSGSLKGLHLEWFEGFNGGEAKGYLKDAHIARLDLSPSSGGRTKAKLEWPLVGTVFLEEDAEVVRVRGKVDLVPGHLWYLDQSRVLARRAENDGAEIERTLRVSNGPKRRHHAPVKCAILRLDDDATPAEGKLTGKVVALDGRSPLYVSAAGDELGKVGHYHQNDVRLLGRSGEYVQIESPLSPFAFRGWVDAHNVKAEKDKFNIGLLREEKGAATHRTSEETALYFNGERTNVSVASGVQVQLLAKKGRFAQVALPGVWPGEQGAYLIELRQLTLLED